jgi:hypothetical protein
MSAAPVRPITVGPTAGSASLLGSAPTGVTLAPSSG